MAANGVDPSAPQTRDDRWAGWELFLLSFTALFLELMFIRWAPSVVRMIAYYANLILISSFLGLGIGAMIGRSRRSFFAWIPPLLALSVGFLLLAQHLTLPSSSSEMRFHSQASQLINYMSLVGIFLTNAAVFVPLGQRIGSLFERLPPLRAYSWDLGGSLAGTVCFGLFSLFHFSPLIGMGLVFVVIVALLPKKRWLVALPLLAFTLFGVARSNDPNAIWSPYYYIAIHKIGTESKLQDKRSPSLRQAPAGIRTMKNPPTFSVSVNHDFYQPHGTLNLARYSAINHPVLMQMRRAYDLPYAIAKSRDKVLVLGAGGGVDSEVALLNGAARVDAVEIDPTLIEISKEFNPSGIYADPRVKVHIDDGRAFLKRTEVRYDLIIFGWLDSQALFSSMSNLRLDGYIYTVESIRMAYERLGPDGVLSLSFMAGKDWMSKKLIRMVADGTGKKPLVYFNKGQVVICVPKGAHEKPPANFGRYARIDPGLDMASLPVDVPTDDWPFLYLSARTIPVDYLAVIGILLLVCIPAVFTIRGKKFSTNDTHFLLLGLAFLLLETKSIGDCSLYFGATWFVTMVVVAGILLMVLAANLVAMRLKGFSVWMYVPVFASLILIYMVDRELILSLDLTGRLLWTLLVVPLPVFFAGLIFSTTFRGSAAPAALFGANLIGAMIGGFCEYLSMLTGAKSLMLIIVAAYLASLFCRLRMQGMNKGGK